MSARVSRQADAARAPTVEAGEAAVPDHVSRTDCLCELTSASPDIALAGWVKTPRLGGED